MPRSATARNPTALHLWVFAPSLRFASSGVNSRPNGQLAAKIFSAPLSVASANALLDKGNVEELLLPAEALAGLESALGESSAALPPSARRFREWDVGLLERYEA